MKNKATESINYSLEKRISYQLVFAMLPMLLVLMFIIHKSIHLLIDEIVVERLQHDALSLISSISLVDEAWKVEVNALPAVYQRVKSGHYFILKWGGNEIRSRSLWDKKVLTEEFVQGDTEDYLYFWIEDEFWVVHHQSFSKQGESFDLWVAEDISEIDHKQKLYEYFLASVLIVFTLFFIFWQKAALKKGMALLEPIQNALKNNQETGNLIFPQEVPNEIKGLVDSINVLVDRSSRQIARSRMSVGNLAHELKRPLQELHIVSANLNDAHKQETLNHIILQLQERIDAELKRARIAGNPMPGTLFNIDDEVPILQNLLNRIYAKSIVFSLETDVITLPFDRDDMLELLGNLMDNAWKYADSQVLLRVSVEGNQFMLSIEDDGPGVPEELYAEINRRGKRVDENNSFSGDGLGLSICLAITESYNGDISFRKSSLGGLRVDVAILSLIID